MKRLLAALCCLLMLSGCASSSEDLPEQILEEISIWNDDYIPSGSNMHKKYYSYYLPQGIGRRDSNELSEVFIKQGYRLILNFDPSAIVIDNFYEETSEEAEKGLEIIAPTMEQKEQKTTYQGTYRSSMGEVREYRLQSIENNGQYLLYLDGTIAKIYTYVPSAEVASSLRAMMCLIASIDFNEKEVLQDFSLKSLEEAEKKNIDYLEQNLPSSGSLVELLNGKEPTLGVGDSTQ